MFNIKVRLQTSIFNRKSAVHWAGVVFWHNSAESILGQGKQNVPEFNFLARKSDGKQINSLYSLTNNWK